MKAFWHKGVHHKLLPVFFASTLVGVLGAIYYSGIFAGGNVVGNNAIDVAYCEAGGYFDCPAEGYFEKRKGATEADVAAYGPVAIGTDNITKYNGNNFKEWSVSQAWCANFISWVYKKAGFPFAGGLSGGWRYASTDALKSYLVQTGTRITDPNKVQAGDIFWRSGHMGLVKEYDANRGVYLTIEGNTYGGGDKRHRVMHKEQSVSKVQIYRPFANPGTGTGPGDPTPPSGGDSGGTTTGSKAPLQSVWNNRCLDFDRNQKFNGGLVQQWTCNAWDNQQFYLESVSGGIRLRNQYSNLCVDFDLNTNLDGGRVQQWTCNGLSNQTFIKEASAGGFRLRSLWNNRCIDFDLNTNFDSGRVMQWTCNGNVNQAFYNTYDINKKPTGTKIVLQSIWNNRCLDFDRNQNRDAGQVFQWTCNNFDNQQFVMENVTGGVRLKNLFNGRCIDFDLNTNFNGGKVQQWFCNGQSNQTFIYESSAGGFRLRSAWNNRCIDFNRNQGYESGQILQWACHTDTNQAFHNIYDINRAPIAVRAISLWNGRCVDFFTFTNYNTGKVVQWNCHGESNQYFAVEGVPGGYRLKNLWNGRCVDFDLNTNFNGGKVQQWECLGNVNQTFVIEAVSSAGFRLKSLWNGRCLDFDLNTNRDEGVVQQWDCNGWSNQSFRTD